MVTEELGGLNAGKVSCVLPLMLMAESKTGAPLAVDRALRKNAPEASTRKGYDLDARAIAKVLVRHYGDEAEAVLKRVGLFLDEARRTKR